MSTTTDAIEIIDRIEHETTMSRETAKTLINFVERQRGDLATNQDLQDGINFLRNELEPLKRDGIWLKWIMGGAIVVMIGGFTVLLTITIYLHSNTNGRLDRMEAEMNRRFTEQKAEMKEIKTEMREIKELLQSR